MKNNIALNEAVKLAAVEIARRVERINTVQMLAPRISQEDKGFDDGVIIGAESDIDAYIQVLEEAIEEYRNA